MLSFEDVYQRLLKAAIDNNTDEELASIREHAFDPHALDCLLNPQKHPIINKLGACDCGDEQMDACAQRCPFDALIVREGDLQIDGERCVACSICADECRAQKLRASKDVLPVLEAVCNAKGVAYALIAPAFHGQFSAEVTPGKLRSAFKALGFDGMVEVALFADILTLKEALEFDQNIHQEKDYQLASACCPMWIAMIRKVYHELMPHVPCAVSPMIACGRTIKHLHPDALTVFVGPCLAKKAEAREADVAGAVDFVLTFQEVQDIFDCAGIDPAKMEDTERDHSSRAGRIYAHTGGVSEAVESTLEKLSPRRDVTIRTQQANGIIACKAMLNELMEGKANANFYEGMGCVGGCVGGPKAIIDKSLGKENVQQYGDSATFPTPIDNPYVIELLKRLGLPTQESLLEHSDIFTRTFATGERK